MRTSAPVVPDQRKTFAAQNAQLGLINANDLSALTGIEVSRLNSFAKNGFLGHYGEYHGKRFFNFQEIVNWLYDAGSQEESKSIILSHLELMLKEDDCPFTLKKSPKDANGARQVRIVWKETATK